MSDNDRLQRSRIPHNLDELAIFQTEGVEVYSWGPERDGKGPSTQVHIHFSIQGLHASNGQPLKFAVRFKSKAVVNAFITALEEHRNHVWPAVEEA